MHRHQYIPFARVGIIQAASYGRVTAARGIDGAAAHGRLQRATGDISITTPDDSARTTGIITIESVPVKPAPADERAKASGNIPVATRHRRVTATGIVLAAGHGGVTEGCRLMSSCRSLRRPFPR